MEQSFPKTIDSGAGERITFLGAEGDKVILEASCKPGCGPIMHVHFKQEEGLTVVKGKLGYQLLGGEKKYALPGESVVFKRGEAHRFWAEGNEDLHLKGWVQPANSIVFYLSSLYAAMQKSGTSRPEMFDGAYLSTRYASEYDVPEIPGFVKKVIMPATYQIGKLLGKYEHFKNAPEPMK